MKWSEFVAIGCEFPEVVEVDGHALKVRGKPIARHNIKLKAFVLRLPSVEEQDFLVEMAPHIYFLTDHYKGWPGVLARPGKLPKREARLRLECAWRLQAPKTLVKKYDAR